MIPHCGVILHFPDTNANKAPFHMFIDHLEFLFCEVNVQVFCPFFFCIIWFLLIDFFEVFIYILGTGLLQAICAACIFSHSMACLLTIIIVPFEKSF